MNVIRILLIEEYSFLREAIAGILNAEPDMKVVTAGSINGDLHYVTRACRPDVLLVNLGHGNKSGRQWMALL